MLERLRESLEPVRGNDRKTVENVEMRIDAYSSRERLQSRGPDGHHNKTKQCENPHGQILLARQTFSTITRSPLAGFLRTIRDEHTARELVANKPSQNCQRPVNRPKPIS
jgi:hypothetical protein